ncbi:MAG: sulfatase-like hydrolase/transferase, partial [Armatimonadota bacterium]
MEREQVGDASSRERGWASFVLPGVASGAMAGMVVLARDRLFMVSFAHLEAPWEFVLGTGPRWFVAAAIGITLGATIGPATGALDRFASRRFGASIRTLALVLVAVAAVGLRLALVRHGHADQWLDIGIVTCVLLALNPHLDRDRASAVGWAAAAGGGAIVATAVFFTANSLLNDLGALLLQVPAYAVAVAVSVFLAYHAHRLLSRPMRRAAEGIGPAGAAAALAAIAIVPGLLLAGTEAWTAKAAFKQQLAHLSAAPRSGEATDRPNVILISVDTLRADHVGYMGGPVRTPTIDAIAEESYVFERAYAVAPWTRPSIAAFLSGRYPYEMGVARTRGRDTENVDAIPFRWREDRDLLAE